MPCITAKIETGEAVRGTRPARRRYRYGCGNPQHSGMC